ncbi:MAG TPA: hypothetical protein VJC05_03290 [Candidatus Andersenbacteria bacterium]|nr:MAG: hypothetical protein A2854_05170 [Parcubacteria group bacterium RIFCSPHIGHO2_01_FULL_56_18]HLD26040.1 hypothetical protein [Candidatus Andersenbacteria bacterium]
MDLTRLWALAVQHSRTLSLALSALLIFAAGWLLGRAMSPYYAASPIVFEDKQCEACTAGQGTSEQLQALQEQGRGEQVAAPPAASPTPGAVAGATAGQFVGSVNSDLYHHRDCPIRIKTENQIWFSSVTEAESAGYKPSKCTQEKLQH